MVAIAQAFRLALLLAPSLSGADVSQQQKSTGVNEHCLTSYAATEVDHVDTSTVTFDRTDTWTRTVVLTPSTTIVGQRSTTTDSVVLVETCTHTGSHKTDTTTITLTSTESKTHTVTATSTSVSTKVVKTTSTVSETKTVKTVSGFTPAASLPSVIENGGGDTAPPTEGKKRSVNDWQGDNHLLSDQSQHQNHIVCYRTLEVLFFTTTTVTADHTVTFTAPNSLYRDTVTLSKTTTRTATPADKTVTVRTTVTQTTTVSKTITSVATSTTTRTTTSFKPIATEYAACAQDNILGGVGGDYIVQVHSDAGFVTANVTGDFGACCATCMQTPNCAGFIISGPPTPPCVLIPIKTCNPKNATWTFYGGSSLNFNVVGDGNCGQGEYSTGPVPN